MTQSWTPNLNGVAGINAVGSYSQTTDADGAPLYSVSFVLTMLRSSLTSLAASSPSVPLYIGGLPVSTPNTPGTGEVFTGPVGRLNGLSFPEGYTQLTLTASDTAPTNLGLMLTGSGLASISSMPSDLLPQTGSPGRSNPGNFFQIAGSITFHG